MKTELNISLVQFDSIWENRTENLERLNTVLNGVPQNTDLVILPEKFATGFSVSPKKMAETMTGQTVNWMRESAIAGKYAITGSVIIEDQGNFYNRLIFAYPDGTFKFYDKRHLFRYAGENKEYTQGKQRIIAELHGWRVCPLIGYDLRFPVWSANRNDYDLLIFVANWPEVRKRAWEVLPEARAVENQSFVAAVSSSGSDEDNNYVGQSRIIDFKGNIVTSAGQSSCIISASLDFDHLHRFRMKYDFVRDADKYGIFY